MPVVVCSDTDSLINKCNNYYNDSTSGACVKSGRADDDQDTQTPAAKAPKFTVNIYLVY